MHAPEHEEILAKVAMLNTVLCNQKAKFKPNAGKVQELGHREDRMKTMLRRFSSITARHKDSTVKKVKIHRKLRTSSYHFMVSSIGSRF
jgi:hypothetical protein